MIFEASPMTGKTGPWSLSLFIFFYHFRNQTQETSDHNKRFLVNSRFPHWTKSCVAMFCCALVWAHCLVTCSTPTWLPLASEPGTGARAAWNKNDIFVSLRGEKSGYSCSASLQNKLFNLLNTEFSCVKVVYSSNDLISFRINTKKWMAKLILKSLCLKCSKQYPSKLHKTWSIS